MKRNEIIELLSGLYTDEDFGSPFGIKIKYKQALREAIALLNLDEWDEKWFLWKKEHFKAIAPNSIEKDMSVLFEVLENYTPKGK